MRDFFDLLARIFLSAYFLYEAYDSVAFFKSTKTYMAKYGLTWQQDMLMYIGIAFLIVGGLMVLIGYRAGLGATLLMIYWIPYTLLVYAFWNSDIEHVRIQSIHFMKNFGIIGGLIFVILHGTGKYSIKRVFASTRI